MGKYIVKLGRCERLYKASVNGNGKPNMTWLSPEIDLTPYTEPDLEQIRKEAYEKGLSDAEEGKATCQYCEYQYLDDTEEPCKKCCNAYMNKYKPKAKEEQIQIGDEVIIRNKTAVVTEITDRYVRIMYSDGSGYALFSEGIVKTGRHFPEIVAVLEKMRGEQDG